MGKKGKKRKKERDKGTKKMHRLIFKGRLRQNYDNKIKVGEERAC